MSVSDACTEVPSSPGATPALDESVASPLIRLSPEPSTRKIRHRISIDHEILKIYAGKADGIYPLDVAQMDEEDTFDVTNVDWEKEYQHVKNPKLEGYRPYFSGERAEMDAAKEERWWSSKVSATETKLSIAEARLLRNLRRRIEM